MVDMIVTNNASASLQIWNPVYKLDQVFTAAGAVTYPKGMVVTLTAGKYVPYVADSGDAHGVLTQDIVATGAGDLNATILIGGEVREEQLGTSDSMVAVTSADILGLQNFGIIAKPTNQLGELDNQ
jgi:hypothetical protein